MNQLKLSIVLLNPEYDVTIGIQLSVFDNLFISGEFLFTKLFK